MEKVAEVLKELGPEARACITSSYSNGRRYFCVKLRDKTFYLGSKQEARALAIITRELSEEFRREVWREVKRGNVGIIKGVMQRRDEIAREIIEFFADLLGEVNNENEFSKEVVRGYRFFYAAYKEFEGTVRRFFIRELKRLRDDFDENLVSNLIFKIRTGRLDPELRELDSRIIRVKK